MSNETEWESSKFLSKAVVYGGYSKGVDRSTPLYGFWSALSLELLARAALAKIHPVLLADPQDGKNILYVFGVAIPKGEPMSIPAKSVYTRCLSLISEYDEKALQHCLFMARARNTEVHSGDSGFEQMTHNRWQPEHYRVIKTLCDFLQEDLEGFFDLKEASAIEDVLAASSKEIEGVAKGKVKTNTAWFKGLPETERDELGAAAIEAAKTILGPHVFDKEHKCAACSSIGLLSGDRDVGRNVKLDDGNLIETITVMSARFCCGACRLDLNREELIAVGMSPTFTHERWVDPVEHFEVDPRDYFDIDDLDTSELEDLVRRRGLYIDEPDYGND